MDLHPLLYGRRIPHFIELAPRLHISGHDLIGVERACGNGDLLGAYDFPSVGIVGRFSVAPIVSREERM
jgi:hypothetical protein